MVFTKIFLVRGVLIDRDTFFSMFKDDLKDLCTKDNEDLSPNYSDKFCEDQDHMSFLTALCEVMDVSDPDFAIELYYDFLRGKDYVFAYPCCSDLAVKQWVVGVRVGELDFSPETILNTTVTLEGLVDLGDEEWEAVCKKHSLGTLLPLPHTYPRTYLMLDDCVRNHHV